jgi:hypothetical protein
VEFWKVTANIGVDRDNVPRCDNQIVKVGKGGFDDVVEEIRLDLRRYGVESLAFDVFRNGLQPLTISLRLRVLPSTSCQSQTQLECEDQLASGTIFDSFELCWVQPSDRLEKS